MNDNYTWIQTYAGKKFDYNNISTDSICIEDIAHSLSLQCRFAGQSRRFYSVAEHCVLVSRQVPSGLALEGLLHDAAEAYVTDIPTPLKNKIRGFREIELSIQKAIHEKFLIKTNQSDRWFIKNADMAILKIEAVNLVTWPHIDNWTTNLPDPAKHIEITCWEPIVAEQMFLDVFYDLELRRAA